MKRVTLGSSSSSRAVAQLVEQRIPNPQVVGSSPSSGLPATSEAKSMSETTTDEEDEPNEPKAATATRPTLCSTSEEAPSRRRRDSSARATLVAVGALGLLRSRFRSLGAHGRLASGDKLIAMRLVPSSPIARDERRPSGAPQPAVDGHRAVRVYRAQARRTHLDERSRGELAKVTWPTREGDVSVRRIVSSSRAHHRDAVILGMLDRFWAVRHRPRLRV